MNTRIRLTFTLVLLPVWLVLGAFSHASSSMAQALSLTQPQVDSAMNADYAALPAPLTVTDSAQWNALTSAQQTAAYNQVSAELASAGATSAQIQQAQVDNEYYFAKDAVWPIGLPALSLLCGRRRRRLAPAEMKSQEGKTIRLWTFD